MLCFPIEYAFRQCSQQGGSSVDKYTQIKEQKRLKLDIRFALMAVNTPVRSDHMCPVLKTLRGCVLLVLFSSVFTVIGLQ